MVGPPLTENVPFLLPYLFQTSCTAHVHQNTERTQVTVSSISLIQAPFKYIIDAGKKRKEKNAPAKPTCRYAMMAGH